MTACSSPAAFSTDGNALSDDFEHHTIGLRTITRESQFSGQRSPHHLDQGTPPARRLSPRRLPGRKFILWISPGFPLALRPPAVVSHSKAAKQADLQRTLTYFSSQLRQNNITLYDVNPFGVAESTFAANYYQNFLKGVTRPDDAQLADLSVQVLSVQTGGLTLDLITTSQGMIQKCLTDADSWYEITFDPPPADKPNEYHHIEVRLDQPGLIARTRNGYYANPVAVAAQ